MLEEEVISSSIQKILGTLKVYNLLSERVGLEMALQNGQICASNLNFYRTPAHALGNVNCVTHPLSDDDRKRIKASMYDILRTLSVRLPNDLFGNIELIAEYDPANKMRIRNILLNVRSTFRLN